jgi:hypothetical protein
LFSLGWVARGFSCHKASEQAGAHTGDAVFRGSPG